MKKRNIFKELVQGLKEALAYAKMVNGGRSSNEAAKSLGMRVSKKTGVRVTKRRKK